MKRILPAIFVLALAFALTGCEDFDKAKDTVRTGQEVISQYGQQIEDSKEKIQEGLGQLQGIADEAWQKTNGSN